LVLLDHGLYRQLDDKFRLDYCHLWKALIESDKQEIKYYCEQLGVGKYYEILASMMTLRTWNNLHSANKMGQKLNRDERKEIYKAIGNHFVEITEVLAKVPRHLLLMFKTQDLLRGINNDLGIPINTFLITARWCVTGINHELWKSKDAKFIDYYYALNDWVFVNARLTVYQFILWFYSFWNKHTITI